jgi:hypothetical protein
MEYIDIEEMLFICIRILRSWNIVGDSGYAETFFRDFPQCL